MSARQPPESQMIDLHVLGPFELELRQSGERIPVTTAKMRALLAYLAAAERHTDTRRQLAILLWERSSEEQARQSLRQMLSNFRRGASPLVSGILAPDDANISLGPSVVGVDRAALMEARPDADVADLSRTADLYRGDFGLGLEIGEPGFDAWLGSERVRCRDSAIALFDRLVRKLADSGRHEEALARANRLAEIEPTREETHRLVITEEAIVSGRASAMHRYEAFRLLLKDELSVRPEAATLRLLDELRQKSTSAAPPPPPYVATTNSAATSTPRPDSRFTARRRLLALLAASLVGMVLLGGMVAEPAWRLLAGPITYIDDDTGRASIVVLRFESAAGHGDLRDRASAYEAEVKSTFARRNRLTMVELPDTATFGDPAATGRALHARYVIKTVLTETPAGMQADVNLIDSSTAATVASSPLPVDGSPIGFAYEFVRSVFFKVAVHRAKTLSATAPDSTPALLWRAIAARNGTRVGAGRQEEFSLYETVLSRDPNQLYALLGLADALIQRAARDQSDDRAADISRAETLLLRAREQSPDSEEIALNEGMLQKLQQNYQQAELDFERAVQLDRTQWVAAAQAAHCEMFLGRFDSAYERMEAAVPNLVRDTSAAEMAFIAAETALVAGHTDAAIAHLGIAIAGNDTVSRIYALRAAALWMADRQAEARADAQRSQTLKPAYTPDKMSRRSARASEPYRAARDVYTAAFRRALAPAPTD